MPHPHLRVRDIGFGSEPCDACGQPTADTEVLFRYSKVVLALCPTCRAQINTPPEVIHA